MGQASVLASLQDHQPFLYGTHGLRKPDASLPCTEECHFSCKRKDQMVKHIRHDHGIDQKSQAVTLAEKWLKPSGKTFWSCGLCIALFSTYRERLKHINVEHFKNGHKYNQFNVQNVIQGLLLQPRVNEAWEAELVARHGSDRPIISWDPARIGNLQLQLEFGADFDNGAQDLAKAAYEASEAFNRSPLSPGPLSLQPNTPSVRQHYQDLMPWQYSTTDSGIDMADEYGSSEQATTLNPAIGDSVQSTRTSAGNRNMNHNLQYSISSADPVFFTHLSDFPHDEDNLFEKMMQ